MNVTLLFGSLSRQIEIKPQLSSEKAETLTSAV